MLIFPYAIVNTMVSLKYETNSPGDCISLVDGRNLCVVIKTLEIAEIILVICLISMIVFRTKILSHYSARNLKEINPGNRNSNAKKDEKKNGV